MIVDLGTYSVPASGGGSAPQVPTLTFSGDSVGYLEITLSGPGAGFGGGTLISPVVLSSLWHGSSIAVASDVSNGYDTSFPSPNMRVSFLPTDNLEITFSQPSAGVGPWPAAYTASLKLHLADDAVTVTSINL